MCGIYGTTANFEENILKKKLYSMKHRGPDFNALKNTIKLGMFPTQSVEYKFLKGILLFFNGEHDESVFLLESIKLHINRLVKIDTILNFEYFLYLGMGYQSMNLFSDAIEYYKIYITYNMKSETTLTNLFQCFYCQHRNLGAPLGKEETQRC